MAKVGHIFIIEAVVSTGVLQGSIVGPLLLYSSITATGNGR